MCVLRVTAWKWRIIDSSCSSHNAASLEDVGAHAPLCLAWNVRGTHS